MNKKQEKILKELQIAEEILKKKNEAETKSALQFKTVHDSRKISRESNSARSFVGIDTFSDDGNSQDEYGFGGRKKSE